MAVGGSIKYSRLDIDDMKTGFNKLSILSGQSPSMGP